MKQLVRKYRINQKYCPHCMAIMDCDVIEFRPGIYHIMYECPNDCELTYEEEREWVQDDTRSLIYYEEEELNICTELLH